jgi:diguanylate cyclase (GGDEF)-like protein
VSTQFDGLRRDRRLMAYTAAGMYGGAAALSLIEGLTPGGPPVSAAPGVAALGLFLALVALGPRLPRPVLALLAPLGVVLIAAALATTNAPGDGAVLYLWPVLWMSFFFGRRGAIAIVACVAVAHGIALSTLPSSEGYADRWVDVMGSVSVVAAVVQTLAHRNDRLLDQLAGEARTDPLTNLMNRRGFDERAAVEIAHARRDEACLAVATFDLDHFKLINDRFGHDTGDRVLSHLGSVLVANAREIDVVARIGGEEFVVLLPGATVAGAVEFSERIRNAIATDDGGLPTIQVSAGVAASVAPTEIGSILQQADAALYAAKRGGRNRTNVFAQIALTA